MAFLLGCWSILPKRANESQYKVVGRHWGYVGRGQASVLRQHIEVVNIAHAPLPVFGTQRGVELRVARRGVRAATFERSVDKKAAAFFQQAARTGYQILRYRPRRNVQHVYAKHGGEGAAFAAIARPSPVWIGKVDSLRREQIRKSGMGSPGSDAL